MESLYPLGDNLNGVFSYQELMEFDSWPPFTSSEGTLDERMRQMLSETNTWEQIASVSENLEKSGEQFKRTLPQIQKETEKFNINPAPPIPQNLKPLVKVTQRSEEKTCKRRNFTPEEDELILTAKKNNLPPEQIRKLLTDNQHIDRPVAIIKQHIKILTDNASCGRIKLTNEQATKVIEFARKQQNESSTHGRVKSIRWKKLIEEFNKEEFTITSTQLSIWFSENRIKYNMGKQEFRRLGTTGSWSIRRDRIIRST